MNKLKILPVLPQILLSLGAIAVLNEVNASLTVESDVCASGYVWREARPTDHVCVTPASRALVKQENRSAPQRWTAGAYGSHTCKQGYVWREAFKGDDVCVTPERRDQVHEENRVAKSHRK